MRKLILFCGTMVLVVVAPLAAQNTVDVLGGPQPANTTACIPPFTHCIVANWSTTSNANPTPADITTKITANFVFVRNGGAVLTDFPAATSGRICLADSRDLSTPTLFAQIADNCKLAGGVALLLIRDAAATAPSTIPVFTISTADGDFLRNTVGFSPTTGISNFSIEINPAAPNHSLGGPTGQHNCPSNQAVPAFVGTGTANYT